MHMYEYIYTAHTMSVHALGCMHTSALQRKLKEAQQKEQDLNAKLRQYRDDFEAMKVHLYFVLLVISVRPAVKMH